ncbi:DUF5131 family protein [Leptospirillum ferriphilum]|uniref:DUF5131 family protein n=1 Tax=Leptospirillum ferriphilum TaxID=178606 RepID=UPI0006B1D546|nr:phage Gp37/Gp68 family protein [Leptospirillum ferriphilum]
MADQSKIAWTDATWNPVTGCSHVSEGCRNCYAEREWPRLTRLLQAYSGRSFENVACHPERLDQPIRWKHPRKIFVNSMSDLFHPDVPEDFIRAVFAIMAVATWHTFQILTKRPERMMEVLTRWDYEGLVLRSGYGTQLPNIWLGVSVEDQKSAEERIPVLLETPAAVRWVSVEPMIGPVTFRWAKWQSGFKMIEGRLVRNHLDGLRRLDWIVVGGESGQSARPMEAEWVRKIVHECREAKVPLFVKQLGARFSDEKNGIAGASLNIPQEAIDLLGRRLKHRSGSDMEEWPEELKVREYPENLAIEKIS